MKNLSLIITVLLGILSLQFVYAQDMIQIKGSDTSVNLVQMLAETYMEKNPNTPIVVTGGGSGVGIAALISNQIQIADASRPMSAKEYAAAKENGVIPVEIAIGIDALSVIVNAQSPVKSMSMMQIGAIYRGEITNWKEVGGPDMPISLYGRQPSSGTFVFFQEHVMNKKDYSMKMKQMNGNAQIVEGVKNDKAAIGYIGVGYVYNEEGKLYEGINVLDVSRDDKSEAISPLISENVKSGKYPIARPLLQYTNGKPKGKIRDFMTFIVSEEGQKVVEKMGFYPISGVYVENNKKAGL
jgi:phosphate transport system substrate-binding protein